MAHKLQGRTRLRCTGKIAGTLSGMLTGTLNGMRGATTSSHLAGSSIVLCVPTRTAVSL